MSLPERIVKSFCRVYRRLPQVLVRSPGRINLLGEHTDYNGGTVLPAAIDRAIWLAAAARRDTCCALWACDYGEGYFARCKPSAPLSRPSWPNYLLGVLVEMGWPGGVDIAFGGDLPIGAGVSSSAALENAVALAANAVFQKGLAPLELVHLTHRAETYFVGVPCGLMDMFAGLWGRENAFLHLSCSALKWEYLPFSTAEWVFVLCHSGVERRLAASRYAERRRECAQGLAILRELDPALTHLSKASLSMLEAARRRMAPAVFRRCRYVLAEEGRVAEAAEALRLSEYEALGALMWSTHEGLRDDFEVSCPELDFLVEQAMSHPACAGARLMGAGFGGCTLNLVRRKGVDDLLSFLTRAYTRAYKRSLPAWVVKPSAGAHSVPLSG